MYLLFLKRKNHIASEQYDPQLEHSLCGTWIGDAESQGDFDPGQFKNVCLDCVTVYLRRERLVLVGITTEPHSA